MKVALCNSEEYVDQLAINFTATINHFGSLQTVELETGGEQKRVTLKNKNLFVKKLCHWHLIGNRVFVREYNCFVYTIWL